jgi:hypothetical protein
MRWAAIPKACCCAKPSPNPAMSLPCACMARWGARR